MTLYTKWLSAAVAASLLPTMAWAQDSVTRFRLAQDPKNIQGCIAFDSALTRVHTFTLKNGQAEIKSAGGIDDTLKLVRPNVYERCFSLAAGTSMWSPIWRLHPGP